MAAGKKPIAKQPKGFATLQGHPVKVELFTEHASIQPGGRTRVGVYFDIQQGWHIYAEDPGDAGLPTKVTWKAPAAVSFGSLNWPKAQQFLDPGNIKTFGYTDTLMLYSSITYVPLFNLDQKYPDLQISANIEWLACKEVCLPGSVDVSLSLPVSATPPAPSQHADLFSHAAK